MMSIIIGIVTVAIGVVGMSLKYWDGVTGFQLFLRMLVSVVPALLIISGAIAVIAGMSGLKDKTAEPEKTEENKQ